MLRRTPGANQEPRVKRSPKKVIPAVIAHGTRGLLRLSGPHRRRALGRRSRSCQLQSPKPRRKGKTVKGWGQAKAVAKRGARVETEPSIKPEPPGWTTRKRNLRAVSLCGPFCSSNGSSPSQQAERRSPQARRVALFLSSNPFPSHHLPYLFFFLLQWRRQ